MEQKGSTKSKRFAYSIQGAYVSEGAREGMGASGAFIFIVGVLLGWLCCFLTFSSGLSVESAAPIILIATLACVLFAASRIAIAGVFTRSGRKSAAKKQVAAAADGESAASNDEQFSHNCDLVAQQAGLSRREREVLGLLARGRNADYIKDALVISSATAKSHIYNVYKKMGVHDQQSVIDHVEAIDGSIAPYELW